MGQGADFMEGSHVNGGVQVQLFIKEDLEKSKCPSSQERS